MKLCRKDYKKKHIVQSRLWIAGSTIHGIENDTSNRDEATNLEAYNLNKKGRVVVVLDAWK